MVQRIRHGQDFVKGMIARFGEGTVRIHTYILKTRFGGQIELTTCKPTEIGRCPDEPVNGRSNKIVLDFANLESLDVVIQKLQDLRSDMANGE